MAHATPREFSVQFFTWDVPHVIGSLPRHVKRILIFLQRIELVDPWMTRTSGGHMFGRHVMGVVPPASNLHASAQRWQAELLDDIYLVTGLVLWDMAGFLKP